MSSVVNFINILGANVLNESASSNVSLVTFWRKRPRKMLMKLKPGVNPTTFK